MDVPRELVDQFVMLTRADVAVASQLLGDNQLNLEAAIASFFAIQEAAEAPPATGPPPDAVEPDNGRHRAAAPAAPAPAAPTPAADDGEGGAEPDARMQALAADEALARQLSEEPMEDDVRAPIPQQIDQILPGMPGRRATGGSARRNHVSQDLWSDGTAHGDTLAALFRPPVGLICPDDLDHAMTNAYTEKRWILVNMQRADVFPCHILNRDVWSDPAVHDLLRARFLFWQRDEATEDGRRYKQFYPYEEPPHVAIIDPRSGERLRVWGGDGNAIKKDAIIDALVDFSDRYSLEDGEDRPVPMRSSRQGAARTRSNVAPLESGAGPSSATRPGAPSALGVDHDVMETEDAQLAAAIAASMEEGHGAGDGTAATYQDDDDDDIVVVDEMNDVGVRVPTAGESVPVDPQHVDRHASRILSATDPELNNARDIRAQQDSEYEESLALDRAKSESEKDEAARSERAAALLDAKRARLPAPPGPDCETPTTELVIRLPSGRRLQRRFLTSNTIGDIYDFVDVESGDELPAQAYSLVVPFPRTSFVDRSMSLQDAGLQSRAALVVDKL